MENEAVVLGMSAAEIWAISAALFLTIGGYIIARIGSDPQKKKRRE